MDAVEELLQQVREHNEEAGDTAPAEPSAETAAVETATVETPPEPERPRFNSLEEFILDDPRLPPTLRGKPGSALYEDREKFMHEAKEAGFKKNRAEAERDMALAALERTLKLLGGEKQQPEKATPAPIKPIDRFRQRGIEPISVLSDSETAIATAIEAGAEEAQERLRPAMETIEERLKRIEGERASEKEAQQQQSWFAAYQQARPEGVTPEQWTKFAPHASAYLVNQKEPLPLEDPKSYREAWEWFTSSSREVLGAPAPQPAVIPSTSTHVPTAPAPPVGSGKPAAPAQPKSKPSSHLNNHQRAAAASIANVFNRNGWSLDVDAILDDVAADPKTRSAFS